MKIKRDILIVGILSALNLIIRIPRFITTAQGLDGFYVVWEAQQILDGVYFSKGANLGYVLGLYPFSGYPVGTLFIMSFFLLLTGGNIMASILIYDYFFTTIFVVGLYFLSKKLNLKTYSTILFVLFASTQPIVLQYSYFNSSARLPYYAIIPFVFGLLIDWIQTKKHIKLAISIVLVIFLGFIHRMSLLLVIVLLIGFVLFLEEYLKSNDRFKERINVLKMRITSNKAAKYLIERSWLILILLSYIVSPFIFMDVYRPAFDLNEIISIENGFLVFIFRYFQMIADQWFRVGLPLILSFICLIILLFPRFTDVIKKINSSKRVRTMLILTLPFLLLANNVYSYYFFFFAYALIPAAVLNVLEFKNMKLLTKSVSLIISSFIVFFYILIYHIAVREVTLYVVVSGVLFGLISTTLILIQFHDKLKMKGFSNLLNKRKLELLLTLTIILLFTNSMFQTDRHASYFNRDDILFSYISDEEMELASFLKEQGMGIFDSFDHVLSIHVAVMSGWFFLQDMHGISILLQSKNITTINDYICSFRPFWQWNERELFACDFRSGSLNYKDLVTNPYNDSLVIDILSSYNMNYFISRKNSSVIEFWDGKIDSSFISSLMESSVPVVFSTDNFLVWNISTIY